MKRRHFPAWLALILAFLCLCGCASPADNDPNQELLARYDGTWYMAKTGVSCVFGNGDIYRYDLSAKEEQTLSGIYDPAGDHVDAHLTGVGSVQEARPLYIVSTPEGDILCDRADGSGQIYFYRDPIAVLSVLEEAAQASPAPDSLPSEEATPLWDDPPQDIPTPDMSVPLISDIAEPTPATPEVTPEPTSTSTKRPITEASVGSQSQNTTNDQAGSGYVWIPKSGSKYHSTSSCSGMKNPSKVTKTDAVNKGFTPCKRCH